MINNGDHVLEAFHDECLIVNVASGKRRPGLDGGAELSVFASSAFALKRTIRFPPHCSRGGRPSRPASFKTPPRLLGWENGAREAADDR